jgi:hypothetical protein
LATEKGWTPRPDGERDGFSAFSAAAEKVLADQIATLLRQSAPSAPGRGAIAEEIFIFNVRPDRE